MRTTTSHDNIYLVLVQYFQGEVVENSLPPSDFFQDVSFKLIFIAVSFFSSLNKVT